MELKVYAVYDSALEAFTQPSFFPGKGVAFRAFQDEVNRPDSKIAKHPEHYTLFELGTFDDVKGVFVSHTAPVVVISAKEVLPGAKS